MANATVTVLEADGTTETDVVVLDVGRQAAAASKSLALSTEDKTALDAAVTALQLLDNAVAGNEFQVDVLTMPTTAVTGTFWQATQPVSLASVPSHAVTNAGTFAVQAALSAAIPAGTNNIGDVDVLTIGGQTPAFGTGASSASTMRVVLANDSPGVSSATGLTTGQNALSTSNEVVIASNASRTFAEIKNVDASITIYFGDDNTVTAANGHALRPGESFAFEGYTGAVWAIAASGTPTVTYVEW